MSINFYISGKRDITVNKTGAIEIQRCDYQPWQTPSNITREIVASASPVEAYKAWVMSQSFDIEEDVYSADDIFDEHPTTRIVNPAKEECAQVDEWCAAVIVLGYELKFYSL